VNSEINIPPEAVTLPAGNWPRYLFGAGTVGLLLSLAGYFVDPGVFFPSYLVAFIFWTTLSTGALVFLMIQHVTGAHWSVVIRRGAEAFSLSLPWLLVFFLPVLLGVHSLYHWSHADAVAHDRLLQWKAPYLNVGFFAVRGVVYFIIWGGLAWLLGKYSLLQDKAGQPDRSGTLRRISAPGIILFAFSVTFAAFDWLMSLDPHWYSTIFGVYIFVGGFLTAIAFLTLFYLLLRQRGFLAEVVTINHYHDLGRLIFTFTIFWAYIGGAQYFLIWYANIPEETVWYLHRWYGSWKVVSLAIVLFHFLIPFLALIFYVTKRNTLMLKTVAGILLVMHYVDMYWLVMPTFAGEGVAPSWMDLTTFVGIGGVLLGLFALRFTKYPALPLNDPKLAASIAHKT